MYDLTKLGLGERERAGLGLRVAASVALVTLLVTVLLAYDASPASAAGGSCSTTVGTTTCTFAPTGSEDTFVVPNGVSTISVVATGAPGAKYINGRSGGRGARVSGNLAVEPGQTLYVEVGGVPSGSNTTRACYLYSDCIGGFNGGGSSYYGGGGGGASDVRTVSRGQFGSLSSRLIVAGGGGGTGSGAVGDCGSFRGGGGGDAGSDGVSGDTCGSISGGTGGKAGTETTGGQDRR